MRVFIEKHSIAITLVSLTIFLISSCADLTGCDYRSVEYKTPPALPVAESPAIPPQKIEITKGWEYDEIVKHEAKKYPHLLTLGSWRFKNVCPNYSKLTDDQKLSFWAALLYGMAGAESSWDRSTMYLETTFKEKDAVTGLPVVSEGLLQLSYQDAKWYEGCEFDYTKDKDKYAADLAGRNGKKSFKSKNLDRSILQADKNLACGVYIMQRLLKRYPDLSVPVTLGKYWYVINPKHSEEFSLVIKYLKERPQLCF